MTTALIIFGVLIVILFVAQITLYRNQVENYNELAGSIHDLWLSRAPNEDVKGLQDLRNNDNEVELNHYKELKEDIQNLRREPTSIQNKPSDTKQLDEAVKKEFTEVYDRMTAALVLIKELQNPAIFDEGDIVTVIGGKKDIEYIITNVKLLVDNYRAYELQEINGTNKITTGESEIEYKL